MMVVAALDYRHQRYLDFLLNESPPPGIASIFHIFDRLEQWMKAFAPHGCMSMSAVAAFPDDPVIASSVQKHKQEVRHFLGQQSQREDLATAIFLLHEGVTSSWPVLGAKAIISAQRTLSTLLEEDK